MWLCLVQWLRDRSEGKCVRKSLSYAPNQIVCSGWWSLTDKELNYNTIVCATASYVCFLAHRPVRKSEVPNPAENKRIFGLGWRRD